MQTYIPLNSNRCNTTFDFHHKNIVYSNSAGILLGFLAMLAIVLELVQKLSESQDALILLQNLFSNLVKIRLYVS